MDGFVYCLSNESFAQDIYKIGLTKGNPIERCKQLYTTGIPTPFKIELSLKVSDCLAVEKLLHNKFKDYRISKKREFFKVKLSQIQKEFELIHESETKNNFKKPDNSGFWNWIYSFNPWR